MGLLAAALAVNLLAPVVAAAALKAPLQALLGTSQVDVALAAWPPAALWWGSVDRMVVLARDVQAGDLRLDRFSAVLFQVRMDPRALYTNRTLVVRAIGSGHAQATVLQEALAGALARQPGVRVDALVLRPGLATFRGAVHLLGLEVGIEGAGRFVLNGPETIDLILDRVTVTGPGSSGTVGGQLTTRVPSVLRAPTLPWGLRLTDVQMGEGTLLLDAAIGPS